MHKTDTKLFIGLVLLVITILTYHTNVIRVYGVNNSNIGVEEVVEVEAEKVKPVKIVQEVTIVEKKVEVEKVVKPFKLKDLGVFKVTAYCPCPKCCGEWTDSAKAKITSIGAGAYEGVTVAVDPSQIPYGTKIYGSDFGVRIATDCGGAIKGKRLDLYFSSHEKALEFGVKYINLYAIEE